MGGLRILDDKWLSKSFYLIWRLKCLGKAPLHFNFAVDFVRALQYHFMCSMLSHHFIVFILENNYHPATNDYKFFRFCCVNKSIVILWKDIEFQKNGSPQEIYLFEILKRYDCSILVKLAILREKIFPGRYFCEKKYFEFAPNLQN